MLPDRLRSFVFAALVLSQFAGCASGPATVPPADRAVARQEFAYRRLPDSREEYQQCIDLLLRKFAASPANLPDDPGIAGVAVELPAIGLPLRRIQRVHSKEIRNTMGLPVILEYDTSKTPYYPPEGLFIDATAIYRHSPAGKPQLQFLRDAATARLAGRDYRTAFSPTAAADELRTRAGRLARTGLMSMLRPESIDRAPRVYLLDPYDPDKIPLLMVHGLQSTPVAFAKLVSTLRSIPAIRARYQIWQFHYASGTPVLANAASLRKSLSQIIAQLDPQGRHPASHGIVVVGHSMGGVIAHTLVSDSQERVWKSVFRVPPDQLRGDGDTIEVLQNLFHFRTNPAVTRAIFMAAPHRGSPVADSFIGNLGNSLARMPRMEERGFGEIARANPRSVWPNAAKFYAGGRFSAVRTLSSRSTALIALSNLPITVPYHSIIGQQQPGSKERGSDGVVPYGSSHLDGAESELIIRSDHGVINKPDAIAEVVRILLLHANQRRGVVPAKDVAISRPIPPPASPAIFRGRE